MLTEFKMTEEQHTFIINAHTNAAPGPWSDGRRLRIASMEAWKKLGDEMGFYHLTAVPNPAKDDYYFFAEPKVTAINQVGESS